MDALQGQASGDPSLGKRLRKLRLERGLTQADLAKPRYTHAHVSTIESGRRMPSAEALRFFAEKLDVEIEELATGKPPGLAAELALEVEQARHSLSVGDLTDAKDKARSAAQRAKEFSLSRVHARACEVEARAWEREGDTATAARRYRRAQELLKTEAATAMATAVAGELRCRNDAGDPHHAVFLGESYLDRLERLNMGTPAAILRVKSALVLAYLNAGSLTEASEAAEQCKRLIPRVNEPDVLAASYVNVAAVQVERGHHADAEIALAKAEELFEAIDLHYEAGTALLARGITMARRGDIDEGKRLLVRAAEIFEETDTPSHLANAKMELGRLERVAGNTPAAVANLDDAIELLTENPQPRLEAWARRELAMALAHTDEPASKHHLEKAIALYEEQEAHVEVARTYTMMANLHDPADAQARLAALEHAAAAIEKVSSL